MGIMDEIRFEKRKIMRGTWKEKWQYFKDYYKGKAFVWIITMVIIIGAILFYVTKKEVILSGIMLNSFSVVSEDAFTELTEDFMVAQQLDSEKVEFELIKSLIYLPHDDTYINENYATIESLAARVTGKTLDFVIGNENELEALAYSEFFTDLTDVLSEAQIAKYKQYFLYIDLAVIEEMEKIATSENYEVELHIPACTKPEEMEQPIPVFIDISKCEYLSAIYPVENQVLVFAVAENSPHINKVNELIDFLMQ